MQLSAQQLDQLDQNGFLILHDAFSNDEVDLLRSQMPSLMSEECAENQREAEGGAVRNLMSLHRRNPVYARLVRHPRMVKVAEQLLGEGVYAQQVKINAKEGFEGAGFDWHTDFGTHSKRDGVEKPLALNFHIFLDEVTEFNGPLWFVPGSHKDDIELRKSVDGQKWELWTVPREVVKEVVERRGLVSAKGKRGTMLIFVDKLLHVSAPNISPYPRWIFSLILNAVSNPAKNDVPEVAHERDRTAITALADNCLTAA